MQTLSERRRTRGQGGFTLIELLVVIAILGVLAAVVVFAVGGINNNSKTTSCKIDKRTLATAVEAYYAQNQAYAADQPALVTAGLLEAPSELYDFTIVGGKPVYAAIAGNPNGCA